MAMEVDGRDRATNTFTDTDTDTDTLADIGAHLRPEAHRWIEASFLRAALLLAMMLLLASHPRHLAVLQVRFRV